MNYIQELTGYSFLEPNGFYLLFLLPVLIWFLSGFFGVRGFQWNPGAGE